MKGKSTVKLFEHALDRFYGILPAPLQSVLVSVQGWRFSRVRYGGEFPGELELLRRAATMSQDELDFLQSTRLRQFLHYSADRSPYYRTMFRGMTPGDLDQFPIMSKPEIRRALPQLCTTGSPASLIRFSTSGTSGTPMNIGYYAGDLQSRFAALTRQYDAMGVTVEERHARFSGRTIIREGAVSSVSRASVFNAERIFSTYHLSPANAELYFNELRRQQPVWAFGYPSAFVALVEVLGRARCRELGISKIMVTAETLTDDWRETIECGFDAEVFNQYASSEGAPFITECRNHRLHCNPETGVFEWGAMSEPSDGDYRRMIVTSFTTHAYPLIRYEIGDVVELETGAGCDCGYQGPTVARIFGRMDDFVRSPTRGLIGRLDPVFKSCPASVLETQIAQVAENELEIRYVPETGVFVESDLDSIRLELERRVGPMTLRFVACSSIARSANGKLRAVVGLVKDRPFASEDV